MKPNPAWADRIISKHWDALLLRAGKKRMPEAASSKGKQRKFDELGCGHYGCVMAVPEENVVFKLTSDPSEAAFVAAALSLPKRDWPPGMIRYCDIVELDARRGRRRVFALWREEASAIGFPLWIWEQGRVTDRYMRDSWRDLLDSLKLFQGHAAIVRKYIAKNKNPEAAILAMKHNEQFAWDFMRDARAMRLAGPQKAAVSLQHCKDIAETMEHTYASDQIGYAFGYYIDQGILLADVHANNVGVATRPPDDDYDDWHAVNVITDPGHMVPIDPKWLHVTIAKL